MKPGLGLYGVLAAGGLLLISGCAVNPLSSSADARHNSAAERDMLADAARAVETAPWPQVEEVSFVSRLTGAAPDDRMTRGKAISLYLDELRPQGARFHQLADDAQNNLAAAERLLAAAESALSAARLTKTDVVMLEQAIQALRENRQIYLSAAKQLEKAGEPVDESQLDLIREAYAGAISELGRAADALADRIEKDRTENFAAPVSRHRRKFPDV